MMLTRSLTAVATVLLVAGCEQTLRNDSTLEPTLEPDIYRWRVMADILYPADSEMAEAARLRQLGAVVRDNRICPAGYSVIRRDQTVRTAGVPGLGVHDIFYTIRCTG